MAFTLEGKPTLTLTTEGLPSSAFTTEARPSLVLTAEAVPSRGSAQDGAWTETDQDGAWTEVTRDGALTQNDLFALELRPHNTITKESVPT